MNTGSALAAVLSPLAFGFIIDATGNWHLPFVGSMRLLLLGAALVVHHAPGASVRTGGRICDGRGEIVRLTPDAQGDYSPVHWGGRFATNASTPSRKSRARVTHRRRHRRSSPGRRRRAAMMRRIISFVARIVSGAFAAISQRAVANRGVDVLGRLEPIDDARARAPRSPGMNRPVNSISFTRPRTEQVHQPAVGGARQAVPERARDRYAERGFGCRDRAGRTSARSRSRRPPPRPGSGRSWPS